jgi:hypothetical protein
MHPIQSTHRFSPASLLFEWLTWHRTVTKWLNECIKTFLRDHGRSSLFVCDAPCLHASASRLATFWPLVLITPLPRLCKRPTRGPRCPQAVHHVTALPCREQMDGRRLARLTRPSTTCTTHRLTWPVLERLPATTDRALVFFLEENTRPGLFSSLGVA